MARFAVILPAAGKSSRFKDKEKKPFVNLDGRAIWLRAAELFVTRAEVAQCVIVIAREDEELFRRRFGANIAFMNVQICLGGPERFESVANALSLVNDDVDFIAIHDAVRPCTTEAQVSAVFQKAQETGAALLGVPVADTLKQVDDRRKVQATVSRKGLWQAQTPQVFRRDWLLEAYSRRAQLGNDITDDAQLVEAAGHAVTMVEGAATNIKITSRADIHLAEAILKAQPKPRPQGPAHPFDDEEMWGGRGPK